MLLDENQTIVDATVVNGTSGVVVGTCGRRLFRRGGHSQQRDHLRPERRSERARQRQRTAGATSDDFVPGELIVQGSDPHDAAVRRVAGRSGAALYKVESDAAGRSDQS